MKQETKVRLANEHTELWKILHDRMETYKQELHDENQKKKESEVDFKEQEKTLKDKLSTMTNMAQKIDDDNRKLMKKN